MCWRHPPLFLLSSGRTWFFSLLSSWHSTSPLSMLLIIVLSTSRLVHTRDSSEMSLRRCSNGKSLSPSCSCRYANRVNTFDSFDGELIFCSLLALSLSLLLDLSVTITLRGMIITPTSGTSSSSHVTCPLMWHSALMHVKSVDCDQLTDEETLVTRTFMCVMRRIKSALNLCAIHSPFLYCCTFRLKALWFISQFIRQIVHVLTKSHTKAIWSFVPSSCFSLLPSPRGITPAATGVWRSFSHSLTCTPLLSPHNWMNVESSSLFLFFSFCPLLSRFRETMKRTNVSLEMLMATAGEKIMTLVTMV